MIPSDVVSKFVGKIFPGGVAVVFRKSGILDWESFGSVDDSGKRPDLDTIYDVASLTKVIVTAPLVMVAVEEGLITPLTKLSDVLEELEGDWKGELRIFDLLTHTSGLPAYHDLTGSSDPRRTVLDLDRDYERGSKVVYSCMGYITLGFVLERIFKKDLNDIAREMIFERIGMESSFFNPPKSFLDRVAPTTLHGKVHDPNARALGGVSGNAGLFTSALDITRFMVAYLNFKLLSRASVEYAIEDHTSDLNDHRGIGWRIKHEGALPFPELLSDGSIGHTGYTGTMVWYDLQRDCGLVLLTNRVYSGDTDLSKRMIQEFRRRVGNHVISRCV